MTEHPRRGDPDLAVLDPGRDDAGYWRRFENRVLTAALPTLARRRRIARATVPDVVDAWSRLVVPIAVAAGVAGLLILGAAEPENPTDVAGEADEVVLPGEEEGYGHMPGFLASDDTVDRDVVFFAIQEP